MTGARGPGAPGPDAVCILGPTCSGKTALALELAGRFPLEIVSVDSALVYRGMDLGTSKPSAVERAAVPHHLIDVCEPSEAYSAGRFRRDALECIAHIRARGRVPLLVGGTMLYFRALTHGLAPLPEADAAVRREIDAEARSAGWAAMHARLAQVDPVAAARIRPLDAQRIQRALEVWRLTGERLSELQRRATPAPYTLARFALMPVSREALYERIDQRFDAMLAAGFLDEVRRLRERGDLDPDLPSLRAVGYRQLWQHLDGRATLEEAAAAARQATRNLAKRQLTWLRADPDIRWIRTLEECELVPISDALKSACGKMGLRAPVLN
ncbi:MAG TPA: tRNA (adenosine(37)-N6)-dimethylallyltransferase MiaA [Steroidobacteraceae bacterium]|nr:tRNA (adenosine(37)-N6)-dimethylallyltransferase MiaA [Steroidobacteraceae bacterium]